MLTLADRFAIAIDAHMQEDHELTCGEVFDAMSEVLDSLLEMATVRLDSHEVARKRRREFVLVSDKR